MVDKTKQITELSNDAMGIKKGNVDVEFGDKTKSGFKPHIAFNIFNGENTIKVELNIKDINDTGAKVVSHDKYSWVTAELEAKLYVKDDTDDVEFELIIPNKPKTNRWVFKVDSIDFNWFYQPPLDEGKYPEGWTADAIHVYDDKGNLINERPINVVGSYAVYHSSKRDNAYQTGKAFHVYRPLVTDAEGVTTWAILHYDGTSLSLIVDQSWLDKAKYPVVIDPTFGCTTAGATTQGIKNTIWGSKFAAPICTATAIHAYLWNDSGLTDYLAQTGIYSYADTISPYVEPLVVSSGSVTLPKSTDPSWYTFDIADTVLDGTDMILLANSNDGTTFMYSDDLDVVNDWHASQTFNTWDDPETLTLTPLDEKTFSIYCDYTLPAGPAGGLRMIPSLKGHMGYDLKTRGGKARRRIF
jgi:hypothetical protein